jgi:hypothetical protein
MIVYHCTGYEPRLVGCAEIRSSMRAMSEREVVNNRRHIKNGIRNEDRRVIMGIDS